MDQKLITGLVAIACLGGGFAIGRATAPKPPPAPVVQVAPAPPRGGFAGLADQLERVAKSAQKTTQAVGPKTSPSSPNPVTVAPGDDEATLKAACAQKWPTDFSMRAYCEKQEREALAKLALGAPPDVPAETFSTIRAGCAEKWPTEFGMRAYCEKQQVDGFRQVR